MITYNLVLELLIDLLLVVSQLLHDHCLSVQSQGAVLVEFLLLGSSSRGVVVSV